MFRLISTRVACAFLLLIVSPGQCSDDPVYEAVGETVVLKPKGDHSEPITSVVWKHNANLAIQWDRYGTNAYRHFKVRGALNTSTGALTIMNLTLSDSGVYTPEINSIVIPGVALKVISRVPKPSISMLCDSENCSLTCEGNTTDAEPVTYKWTALGMIWSSTMVHNISKDVLKQYFSCTMTNPVSNSASDSVRNPFFTGYRLRILLVIPVGLLLVCLICLALICLALKSRKVKSVKCVNGESAKFLAVDASAAGHAQGVTHDAFPGPNGNDASPDPNGNDADAAAKLADQEPRDQEVSGDEQAAADPQGEDQN